MSRSKRRIFISDIHMGIGEGAVGDHPYNWLRKDRAEMLTRFLDALKGDNAVDELVVVGDLFDEWVMPFSVDSPARDDKGWFAKVAHSEENAQILRALAQLAKRAKVSYVHGNHDMQLTKDILKHYAPKIIWVPGSPGMGTYIDDGIHAEHGSLYCLFNAPYLLSGDQRKQIPVGYFMARSDAQFVSDGGSFDWEDYLKMFIDIARELYKGEELVPSILSALEKGMDISPEARIPLYGVDGFTLKTATLREAAELFGDIYNQWNAEWKNKGIPNVSAPLALIGDTGHLYPAANLNFSPSTNLVIFGHTHKWELKGVAAKDLERFKQEINALDRSNAEYHETIGKLHEISARYDPGADVYKGHVYANCGTWIDGTGGAGKAPPATYVEVIDRAGIRTVHVNAYGVSAPLKTYKITL